MDDDDANVVTAATTTRRQQTKTTTADDVSSIMPQTLKFLYLCLWTRACCRSIDSCSKTTRASVSSTHRRHHRRRCTTYEGVVKEKGFFFLIIISIRFALSSFVFVHALEKKMLLRHIVFWGKNKHNRPY